MYIANQFPSSLLFLFVSCFNFSFLALTQLANAASETVKIEVGKRLRLSCDYSGVYVELSREIKEASRRRSTTSVLLLRIEDQDVMMIDTKDRQWNFNAALSRYSADDNNSRLVTELAQAQFSDEGVYHCKDVTKKIINTINVVVICKLRNFFRIIIFI